MSKRKPKPFRVKMKKLGRIVGALMYGFFTGVFLYGIIEIL